MNIIVTKMLWLKEKCNIEIKILTKKRKILLNLRNYTTKYLYL